MRAHFFLWLLVACLPIAGQAQTSGELSDQLVQAAIERTHLDVRYDGSYRSIPFPGGDVPDHIGVCTDLVVRSYRALGIDLQLLVHEDMSRNFHSYPQAWGLTRPDSNIDHRRVPNLMAFFKRRDAELAISEDASNYQPGDLVTWMLPGNLPHIGIVTDRVSETTGQPLIAHNIGSGPVVEDMLFDYEITGHFRYFPDSTGD